MTKLTRRNCLLLVLSKTDKTKLLICLLWCSVNKVDIRRTAYVLLQLVEGWRKKRTYEIVYIFVYICFSPSFCFEGVGLNSTTQSVLSRPMQRKLVTLVHCQLVEEEGRIRAMRAARSLGERTVTELILQHQNPQQLSSNLWAAVRARGCQFLGPGRSHHNTGSVLGMMQNEGGLINRCQSDWVIFIRQWLNFLIVGLQN